MTQIPSLASDHRLGMKDLLPPSPSVIQHGARHSPAASQHRPSPLVHDDTEEELYSRSISALDQRPFTAAPERDESHSRSHSRSISSSSEAVEVPMTGPIVQPLDLVSVIMSHDRTHSALAQTVVELSQWLSVVEGGLKRVLTASEEVHAIGEEYEDDADGYFGFEEGSYGTQASDEGE
jgi:protein-serine/threonine kinase